MAPAFLRQHVMTLSLHTEHQILYHDTSLDIPQWIKDIQFHAIVLDVTFLCARWAPGNFFPQQLRAYEFVKHSAAVKIACPQDEYDCHQLLDDWMVDWKIDTVFSVISNHWDVLYPKYSRQGQIRLAYTGYIGTELLGQSVKPQSLRRIDLGYRARKLPPYFGKIGENKTTIAEAVQARFANTAWVLDIAVGSAGALLGQKWLDFINDSKFTLGANSGSSLLDPVGAIQKRVRTYLHENPQAPFSTVEEACFKGLDGLYEFTAISPRVMEAAVLESAQVLVDGHYSGLLQAGLHYIAIRPDASNFEEVREQMTDVAHVARLRVACKEALLDVPALRADFRAKEISQVIVDHLAHKSLVSSHEQVAKAVQRYDAEVRPLYQSHWRKARARARLVGAIDRHPSISRLLRSSHAKLLNIFASRSA